LKAGELGVSLDHTGFGFSQDQFGQTHWIDRLKGKLRLRKKKKKAVVTVPINLEEGEVKSDDPAITNLP
jgi:hypothetical protein